MKYEVAVIVDKSGNKIGCFRCELLNDKQYNDLKAKTTQLFVYKDECVKKLEQDIKALQDEIDSLRNEIKVLKGEE